MQSIVFRRTQDPSAVSFFLTRLQKLNRNPGSRRWIYLPNDQLSDGIGPLAREKPQDAAIILVESAEQMRRRPYHKKRIALLWANQRHFALEQASRGVFVHYVISSEPVAVALEKASTGKSVIEVMEPAERELREELKGLIESGFVRTVPHDGWITTADTFMSIRKEPPWRMDAFYRHVRRETKILMENGKPVGGKLSYDFENRLPWKGQPPAPEPPSFPVDEIKQEVVALVRKEFADHPGSLEVSDLPATQRDAADLWSWAKRECIPHFGPFEDAMTTLSSGLFHTRISSLTNIHRILPQTTVDDVLAMDIPLPSKEGFVRQVLGWREYVRHVHCATDGFRLLVQAPMSIERSAGDGGYERWSGREWPHAKLTKGGASPSALGAANPLPAAYWGARSGLACLDLVVADVWRDGWSHHITRLMVLSNIASLLDVSPRELTDWFWIAYTDSHDWVVEPNVLGMGTFALGNLMTTKPYISGANYINRMSDYCDQCAFDPWRDCPLTNLYWAYLDRHSQALSPNPRMRTAYLSLKRRSPEQRRRDAEVYQQVVSRLLAGDALTQQPPGPNAALAE